MTCTGLKGRCFLELKSVLLEVSYIEKWPKFAYLESKVPHLKFRVMRDRVYMALAKKIVHSMFLNYKYFLLETRVPVGKMEINSLDNLLRIGGTSGGSSGTNAPTLCDVDLDSSTDEGIFCCLSHLRISSTRRLSRQSFENCSARTTVFSLLL